MIAKSSWSIVGDFPMTYDLRVILEYCGRSCHDLLVLCGWSWPLSGPLLAVLCRSWPTLGTSVGGLGLLLGPAWAVLAALGAFVGGLVPLLGPMWAVLGRSWDLCWRSWAVLDPKVALARAGRRSGKRARPKSGPGPSGKAIWQAGQGRKVAQTQAGRRSGYVAQPP